MTNCRETNATATKQLNNTEEKRKKLAKLPIILENSNLSFYIIIIVIHKKRIYAEE